MKTSCIVSMLLALPFCLSLGCGSAFSPLPAHAWDQEQMEAVAVIRRESDSEFKGGGHATALVAPIVEWGAHNVNDKHLAYLKTFSDLEELTIRSPDVTDAGLAALKHATKLRTLHIDCPQATVASLVHLAGLTSLQDLEITAGLPMK